MPWYFIFAQLKMTGGYLPLILAHMFVSLPLILYIMMSFFDQLPEELEESAQVDGLTAIGAFFRITLPLSVPGIETATILSFIFSWNNFIFALVLSGQSTKTLPVAIFDFIATRPSTGARSWPRPWSSRPPSCLSLCSPRGTSSRG